jgi:hypothetical protein
VTPLVYQIVTHLYIFQEHGAIKVKSLGEANTHNMQIPQGISLRGFTVSPHESAFKWVVSVHDIPHYVNMEVYVIEDNPQEFLHCKKIEDHDTREMNKA